MLKTALQPKWIAALLLALTLSAGFVLLSQWQFSRSTQNANPTDTAQTETPKPLTDTLKPGKPVTGRTADQMVTLTGNYDRQRQVLVPGRIQSGREGYWVVTAFTVAGAPPLTGVAATDRVIIPVARGWTLEADSISPPPSGPLELTARLLPAEAPERPEGLPAEQVKTVSTAELVNRWNISSYRAFLVVNTTTQTGARVADAGLEPITVGPQPSPPPINWLNIFYAIEWFVFAGFAIFLWWRLVADDHERQHKTDHNGASPVAEGEE